MNRLRQQLYELHLATASHGLKESPSVGLHGFTFNKFVAVLSVRIDTLVSRKGSLRGLQMPYDSTTTVFSLQI